MRDTFYASNGVVLAVANQGRVGGILEQVSDGGVPVCVVPAHYLHAGEIAIMIAVALNEMEKKHG